MCRMCVALVYRPEKSLVHKITGVGKVSQGTLELVERVVHSSRPGSEGEKDRRRGELKSVHDQDLGRRRWERMTLRSVRLPPSLPLAWPVHATTQSSEEKKQGSAET